MHPLSSASYVCGCDQPLDIYSTERSHKHRKLKLHASLTASTSSTVAEEIIVLVRRLHPLRAWNPLINRYIALHLRKIPQLIAALPDSQAGSNDQEKEEEEVRNNYFLVDTFMFFIPNTVVFSYDTTRDTHRNSGFHSPIPPFSRSPIPHNAAAVGRG